jgi:phosphate transport system substrate-binding protein
MTRQYLPVLFALVLVITGAHAHTLDALPRYEPEQVVSGTLRSWGNENMVTLMKYWQEGFRKHHPEVRFEDNLKSSATAIGALYSGVADLGLMGREIWPMEVLGFKQILGHEPLGITVAGGAYDVNSKTLPMIVFVNKNNPISKLTLTQLDAIFGSEHLRGAPRNIRKWGDLGLTGEWADKPIKVYGYKVDSGLAFYFAQEVLKGSALWNGELRQIGGQFGVSWGDDAKRAIEDVGKDRYAIAYIGMQYLNPQLVKPIALATQEGEPYIEPTKDNVRKRLYPLTRSVSIFINRPPGKPVEPRVREFMRYVLSREGQEDVIREGDFLPLTPEVVSQQLKKLD